jgi:hypothetical protein
MRNIIYLIGRSGTGKYTIAKELQKFNNYRLADNHLTNNVIFSLLENINDGIPDFAWDAIKKIRDGLLFFIENDISNNYILTNELLEDEGDKDLFEQIKNMSENDNSNFIPVILDISIEENRKRIANLERLKKYKSTTLTDEELKKPLITINHRNLLKMNVSELTPEQACKQILNHISSIEK